jgi:hypothetical protein
MRSREDRRIPESCRKDKVWMNPFLGGQESMWTVDRALSQAIRSFRHFGDPDDKDRA